MNKKTSFYHYFHDWRYTNWLSLEARLKRFTYSSNVLALNYEEKVYPGLRNGIYYITTIEKKYVLRALNGEINGLLSAFTWNKTKEGYKYWSDEYYRSYISDRAHTRLLQIYLMKG